MYFEIQRYIQQNNYGNDAYTGISSLEVQRKTGGSTKRDETTGKTKKQ